MNLDRPMMDKSTPHCSRCQAPLTRDLGDGVCVACLLEEALPAADGLAGPTAAHELAGDTLLVQHFGPYELLEEIGRGGMGVIYKARQPGLDRVVALKMLLAGEFADAQARERLLREAKIAARLTHPNIVTIHEVGEHGGRPYFAMEYVPGRNLAQLCRDSLLPVNTAVRYVEQLARAVHYAHQHGVIHRDLKPANVLISPDDEPKLTDFGLTKSLIDPTRTIESAGSPNFMAPEQADSSLGTTGTPTDVFGLGAILYYLLTGRPPAVGETLSETLRAVVAGEPVAPRQLRPALPRDLETITLKCLEKEPSRRYGSAQEVADELARWQRHEPILAKPATPLERITKWFRRQPVIAGLSIAMLLSLFIGLGATSWQWRQAVLARQRVELSAYYARLMASMSTKFEPMVRMELRDVPIHLRGWEWGHLLGRCLPNFLFAEVSSAHLEGVAVSANHRHIACWHEGRLRIFDAQSNAEWRDPGIPTEHVRKGVFSPDGNFLAMLMDDGSVYGLSMAEGAGSRNLLPPGTSSRGLAFTADSQNLVATGGEGMIRLFAVSDAHPLREFKAGAMRFSKAEASTDGSLIFGFSEAGGGPAFVRWKSDTGELLPDPAEGAKPAVQTVLSGRGDIYARLVDAHRVEVRETATDRLLSTWIEPTKSLVEIALARDGARLLTRTVDGRGLLLDATNGGLVATFSGLTRKLITGPNSEIALTLDTELGYRGWNLETGEEIGLFPLYPGSDTLAAISPDGVLAAGTSTGRLWVWFSDKSRWGISSAVTGKVVALAHGPDSKRFASISSNGQLQVWDTQSLRQISMPAGPESAPMTALEWSRDGRWLVSADTHGFIGVRSSETAETGRRWRAFDGPVRSMAIDAESKWIAVASHGGIGLWELATGKQRWLANLNGADGAVAFEPDGKSLYVATTGGEVWAVDPATGSRLRETKLSSASVTVLACSPSTAHGRQLALGIKEWDIELLDAATFRSQGRIHPSGVGLQHLAYHPDGDRLAMVISIAEEDVEPSRLAIWDPWTQQPVLSLNEPGLRLRTASFSPDGMHLIAGGPRGGIRIWDALPWKAQMTSSKSGTATIGDLELGMNHTYWLNRLKALDRRR